MRIGIIGHGYVGKAIAWAHRHQDIVIRDPILENSADLTKFKDCSGIFVCVPSPMLEDGRCDTSILEQVLKELLFVIINAPIPIICKTTAPPSIYAKLQAAYPNIVHCPEFLTANDNLNNYTNTSYFVLGGSPYWTSKASAIIQSGVPLVPECFNMTDIRTAALYKYMMNSYLATKVTFMNDFKQLADAEGVNFKDLIQLSVIDYRIGCTHMSVPGPDGRDGWGGGCFPKDISAIITEAHELGAEMNLLSSVTTINNKHRK